MGTLLSDCNLINAAISSGIAGFLETVFEAYDVSDGSRSACDIAISNGSDANGSFGKGAPPISPVLAFFFFFFFFFFPPLLIDKESAADSSLGTSSREVITRAFY